MTMQKVNSGKRRWTVVGGSNFAAIRDAWRQIVENKADPPILDAKFFELLLQFFEKSELFACLKTLNGISLLTGLFCLCVSRTLLRKCMSTNTVVQGAARLS